VKKKRVFDAFALLAYLKMESGYEKVKELLSSEDVFLLMNEINLGETYYILARERGIEKAEYFLGTILPSLRIEKVANRFEDVIEASRIKAKYPLSFADCFSVATALKEKAPIVTGDPEFKTVEEIAAIEWM